jgi:hypothetical protein
MEHSNPADLNGRPHREAARHADREGSFRELASKVVSDVSGLAKDEAALARLEIERTVKRASLDAAAFVLGAILALIGLAMLCTTAVVALEPALPPLWARMLLMCAVYLLAGGLTGVTAIVSIRNKLQVAPRAREEARAVVDAAEAEIRHG